MEYKENTFAKKFGVGFLHVLKWVFEGFFVYTLVTTTAVFCLPFIWTTIGNMVNWTVDLTSSVDIITACIVFWWVPALFLTAFLFVFELMLIKQFHKWLTKHTFDNISFIKNMKVSNGQIISKERGKK